jgi:hypothetical protein
VLVVDTVATMPTQMLLEIEEEILVDLVVVLDL